MKLAAPLIGVTAVREARGTLAAAELASAVCAEQEAVRAPAPQVSQKQPAPFNDSLIAVTTSRDPNSIQASTNTASTSTPSIAEPHFAMCEVSDPGKAPIVPPLGWALSKPMREKFPKIIADCGNQAGTRQARTSARLKFSTAAMHGDGSIWAISTTGSNRFWSLSTSD